MICDDNIIYTQKSLAQRYGITISALQQWYPYAGIVKPKKRGGYFGLDAVQTADFFYVATRIRRLTRYEYLERVIPSGGLDEFMRQTNGLSLYDFLTKYISEDEKQDPIVKSVIRRIEKYEAHQQSSSKFTNYT